MFESDCSLQLINLISPELIRIAGTIAFSVKDPLASPPAASKAAVGSLKFRSISCKLETVTIRLAQ